MPKLMLLIPLCLAPVTLRAQQDDAAWRKECESGHSHRDRVQACAVHVETIAARPALTVRAGPNGGISIVAHDAAAIEVHSRIEASARSRGTAEEILKDVKIGLGETITASGPETGRDESWFVSFVIYVPRATSIDAETVNGPVSVRNVVGRMQLHTQNGPLSLNGVGGDVRAQTQNGPLTVRLTGTSWTGTGMDARSTNGPVQLSIPEHYNAVLETGTVNGPFHTDVPLTVTLQGRQRQNVTATLGSGGARLRVTTQNGPVAISRR